MLWFGNCSSFLISVTAKFDANLELETADSGLNKFDNDKVKLEGNKSLNTQFQQGNSIVKQTGLREDLFNTASVPTVDRAWCHGTH